MDTPAPGPVIGATVALKPLGLAKTRLGELPNALRRRIAWCMALDTLRAIRPAVDLLVVVSSEPELEFRLRQVGLPVQVHPDTGQDGINPAVEAGAAALRAAGCQLVLASVADLPALRTESVRRVLAASRRHSRSFVPDASGMGTTMLISHSTSLQAAFQGSSAAAHRRSGAVPLDETELGGPVPDARCDVDTLADLTAAAELGLGPATTALVGPGAGVLGRVGAG